MNILKIRQILIFVGLLYFSFSFDDFTSYYIVSMTTDITKAILSSTFFPMGIKQTITFPIIYISQFLSLFLSGLLIGVFYYENKKLSLITFVFLIFHIVKILIVAINLGEMWKNVGVYFVGYTIVFFLDICLAFIGVMIAKYALTRLVRNAILEA
jgi:hypothetical protein